MKKELSRGKRTRRLARKLRRAARLAGAPAVTVAVTFRHVDPSTALQEYAQRKFAVFAKHAQRPCQVHLILTVDKYRQRGEVTLKSGHFALAAQEETKDLYSVIDLLADKVGRQLRRSRQKIIARKTGASSAAAMLAQAQDSERTGG
ncbi:MAG: ribosome hibernation-promoting factor, HPF/YfiA family [Candidatus Binataceae bacterium]